jgi:hypothetical protein
MSGAGSERPLKFGETQELKFGVHTIRVACLVSGVYLHFQDQTGYSDFLSLPSSERCAVLGTSFFCEPWGMRGEDWWRGPGWYGLRGAIKLGSTRVLHLHPVQYIMEECRDAILFAQEQIADIEETLGVPEELICSACLEKYPSDLERYEVPLCPKCLDE